MEDYTNRLLDDSAAPVATADGVDLDGDGTPDGGVCATLPLVVPRTATPSPVVSGTLYWRVQAVGTPTAARPTRT